MEKRKNTLSTLQACRFCLVQDEKLNSIYDRNVSSKSPISLPLQIMSCLSVEVFPSDRMPSFICDRCKLYMDIVYTFKQLCRQTDANILRYIQNEDALEPTPWPRKLTSFYRLTLEKKTTDSKKAVIDSAPSCEEEFEAEEINENVYNIQIGSDDDENKETCEIKVVKSGDKLHISKDDVENSPKTGFSTGTKLTKHIRSHAGARPYPCKYCEKSFLKSHHYTRHLRVKHKDTVYPPGVHQLGPEEAYSCDQCDATFLTQDELVYHSAKHAAESGTCPLCHEKFDHVEQVTAHIKTHEESRSAEHAKTLRDFLKKLPSRLRVNFLQMLLRKSDQWTFNNKDARSAEFMCDMCELIFASKEKLDKHVIDKHGDEMEDEDAEEEDDDYNMKVKEEDDQLVVEIKKADEFLINKTGKKDAAQNKADEEAVNSEESENETYLEIPAMDVMSEEKIIHQITKQTEKATLTKNISKENAVKKNEAQMVIIGRRGEPVKAKVMRKPETVPTNKQQKPAKTESATGASEKSLRLLEQELQELKRSTSEVLKTQIKIDSNKRRPLHTSTPKQRPTEEKKMISISKVAAIGKKEMEKRTSSKEETKEIKINNNTSNANEKEKEKEQKDKEQKEKDKEQKSVVKNGATDKTPEENVRRSSRTSKIKDYAKLVRDRSSSGDDSNDGDEEYTETEKSETRTRQKKVAKITPKPSMTSSPAETNTPVRKRGRPRKVSKEVPPKVKKTNDDDDGSNDESKQEKSPTEVMETEEPPKVDPPPPPPSTPPAKEDKEVVQDNSNANVVTEPKPSTIVSPTGQTLKKIPIKSLPPGIKPLPLPANARPVGSGELCEMQIGNKFVKVQKIVMTKAEVEVMAKKGLVEMKDGAIVLKQGIKLPASDPAVIKSSLVGEGGM